MGIPYNQEHRASIFGGPMFVETRPERPSTQIQARGSQYLILEVSGSKYIRLLDVGTRSFKHWVLGPSGIYPNHVITIPSITALQAL